MLRSIHTYTVCYGVKQLIGLPVLALVLRRGRPGPSGSPRVSAVTVSDYRWSVSPATGLQALYCCGFRLSESVTAFMEETVGF